MQNLFSLLFYIRRSKSDKNGFANIYLRITVNSKRAELSIRRKVHVEKWNSNAGKGKGYGQDIQELNHYIDIIKSKVYEIHRTLVNQNKEITASLLRDIYIGKDNNQKMLLKIFQDHNDQVNKLVGKDFAHGTAERYRTAKKHIEDYIKVEYKKDDIPVKDVDHKFISGFEYYLKTVRKCGHNTAIKYITNFKKIIRIAYANDWISRDPFYNWKAKLKIVDREFLSEGEIQKMVTKELHTPRLDQVKDIFIFCCFTGLAYADVKKLSKNDIVIGIDSERWIKTKRTKTDTRSNIPLLPTAEAILGKYNGHPDIINSDKVLPVLSNQKMNAYLKEIADLCEIHKNLTFHLARHTFATTVTLTNGVPIESVSKMLGHKSLKTTQHYAKILDRKVSDDMKALRDKFQIEKTISNIV
ncbi:site-specific integrase [Seonamhaeicola maritimus]|uniref:Site-specific integrase n=1 Tax=Seonamhaeicola maritimus TaxID=2591822 RepID=A0A5C7GM64_9FLAO|nr:site-specific integrase [Seonamhaeicola maritimus]TXG39596.1 site-specific integrase [Seonamhaeicola maritimus]